MALLARGSAWPIMGPIDESALEEQTQSGRSESVTEQNIDCTGVQLRERGVGREEGRERGRHSHQIDAYKKLRGVWPWFSFSRACW